MSNGNALVNIFNASQLAMDVSVNQGNRFTIPGTSANQNWQPQQPNSNPVGFANGYPSPNTFGTMGSNMVTVFISGSVQSYQLQISIPQYAPISSLQLYIFAGTNGVSWIVLSSGQLISSGSSQSESPF